MSLLHRPSDLLLLSTAQALYWSCSIIGITLTGLVGQQLAPWPWLSTLPLALLVAGCLLAVGRTARSLATRGAQRTLQRGALYGVAGGLLSALGISLHSFALFSVGVLCVGAYQASAGFYRFVALDRVDAPYQGRAAAWVVAGGIAAALVAPSVALYSQPLLPTPMAGSYLAVAVLAALGVLVLQALRAVPLPASAAPATAQAATTRSALWQRPGIRLALLLAAGGHGVMILVMNATPLAMGQHGHSLAASATVIQWHVLGMFVPSLFAGSAVDRWGPHRVAAVGLVLLAASCAWALSGLAHSQFLISSLLLGAGWNALMLAGTCLLTQSCSTAERRTAQPMMEWTNSALGAAMSLASGALVHTLGWQAINWAMLPVLALMLWCLMQPQRLSVPPAAHS